MNVFWNDLSDVASLQREVDRLFGGYRWTTPARRQRAEEIYQGQDGENLYIEMVLPGVSPESLGSVNQFQKMLNAND